jgi:hypothetical protein
MADQRRGLYVSYDEVAHGPFEGAVQISNQRGCVAWFSDFPHNPSHLQFPTDIIVRLKRHERYFRGILLAIASGATLPVDFEQDERNHRPANWFGSHSGTPRSVLFISHLREVPTPEEVEGCSPPQGATHVNLTIARTQAWAVLLV